MENYNCSAEKEQFYYILYMETLPIFLITYTRMDEKPFSLPANKHLAIR